MPILTKGAVVKGEPSEFSLSKSLLAAHTLVSAHSFFSDSAKWQTVIMVYKSSIGNQSSKVVFDATEPSPLANFIVSERARDIFEIERIDIYDFDGGYMSVQRADLVTAEYDVEASVVSGFVWDTDIYYNPEANGGLTTTVERQSIGTYRPIFASVNHPQAGDFDIEYKANQSYLLEGVVLCMSPVEGSVYNIYGWYMSGTTAILHINNINVGPYSETIGGENSFRIVRIGTTMTFYLNTVLVATVTDISIALQPQVSLRVGGVLNSAEFN